MLAGCFCSCGYGESFNFIGEVYFGIAQMGTHELEHLRFDFQKAIGNGLAFKDDVSRPFLHEFGFDVF